MHNLPRGREPSAICPILSEISFGLPQNVMVISGEEDQEDVSILMATNDIAAGEELVMDFTADWSTPTAISFTMAVQQGFAVKLSDEDTWPSPTGNHRALIDEEYVEVRLALYSNGLVGRQKEEPLESLPGCRLLVQQQCERKNEIMALIDSGDIWKIVNGKMEPSLWTGEIRDQNFWFVG